MRILVCVKRVPLTGGRMVLTPTSRPSRHGISASPSAPTRSAGWRRRCGSSRPRAARPSCSRSGRPRPRSRSARRSPPAPTRGILLTIEGEEWDPQATAAAILAAIEAEEASGGAFDLIVFGNESADSGNFQVGIRVAHALGRPVVTGLKGLTVEDGRARCEQEVAGGRDVYDVPLPAVVTVLEGINLPALPVGAGQAARAPEARRQELARAA